MNPSSSTTGYSFITPRWLFVLAQATPFDVVGDPVLVDETICPFEPSTVRPGDIVGVGISSGNCRAGYRVIRQAKLRGATVIAGGIHATIFPDEPLRMGADAVVTGNGDHVWNRVVADALDGRLHQRYDGGRVPGDMLLKGRWDLLDPAHYMMASIQTVAGCPENCSFCSVWVTDGRQPRQRLASRIIEEANELYRQGFRFIVFADDNFGPATLPRIEREGSRERRRQLENLREERLLLFDEYHRSVPANLYAFTQTTAEVADDEEYLAAMYEKTRIRTALVGVESFSAAGLESANKQWNPVGRKMVEAIRKLQAQGILVLTSVICGLEPDTVESIRATSRFVEDSGSALAQFTIYGPYPGTKDFHEMMSDRRRRGEPGYTPKHKTRIVVDRFWLSPLRPVFTIEHANLSSEELLRENRSCWDSFYSLRAIWRRMSSGVGKSWPLAGKLTYLVICLAFRRIYADHGVSADSVQRRRSLFTRLLIRAGTGIYSCFYRQRPVQLRVRAVPGTGAAGDELPV